MVSLSNHGNLYLLTPCHSDPSVEGEESRSFPSLVSPFSKEPALSLSKEGLRGILL